MKIRAGIFLICLVYASCFISVRGQVKLPSLISDGVVLQRDAPIKIWGWDVGGKTVSVELAGNEARTDVSDNGKWEVMLPSMAAGGPYSMLIKGSSTVNINDIQIGDVWVCSGQSNMELNMNRASPLYGHEIKESENDEIRYFAAPQTYNFNERLIDYNGGKWQKANPQSVLNFGAIAYFFAREVNAKYGIPVGMINTAIGGTPTEAWISEEAIKAFPGHFNELQRFKNKALIDSIEKVNRDRPFEWYSEAGKKDEGHLIHEAKWIMPDINTDNWEKTEIPGYWAKTSLGPVNGIVWFRKNFDVPASMTGGQIKLLMGRIIDADSVFVNGVFIGSTSYQYPPRRYEVPAGVLNEGKNTIVVKVISNGGIGGFVPDKEYKLIAGSDTINLIGEWYFRLGAKMKPMQGSVTVKYKPSGLFNAMIAPLLYYRIKGILWYQGESNAERPVEQRKLFPALINDWRMNWNQGDIPFLYVQLPNFMAAKDQPGESNWALFREAQVQALSVPNTAMAVTIDLGEWNDIHPLNKLDVAKRLFLTAQKVAYVEDVIFSGPLYSSMQIKGNKIIIDFTNKGTGLIAHGDTTLNHFTIAGNDKKFVWAKATIKKNKVIVWNNEIPRPVAVRYAWADNPEGSNLYNREGLPASPFRTDNW
ncbi:MAG TPA: sialate O-acetylesterase [Bacteroidales bacterium]|jgi:sialate O-acetylesterase|nr:sialate O-acetylesterase [Bacteroidales bacterium]